MLTGSSDADERTTTTTYGHCDAVFNQSLSAGTAAALRHPRLRSVNSLVNANVPIAYTPFTLTRFKPRFCAVLQQQRTAGNRKYTADEPHVSVTFRTLFNFSARILRKAVKRKETAKTVKEPY